MQERDVTNFGVVEAQDGRERFRDPASGVRDIDMASTPVEIVAIVLISKRVATRS